MIQIARIRLERMVQVCRFGFGSTRRTTRGYVAGHACRIQQCLQMNIVRVGKCGFVAKHGANADALVNIKAACLNNTLFQTPAFGTCVLKIDVRIVRAMRRNLGKHAVQILDLQTIRREQNALRRRQITLV